MRLRPPLAAALACALLGLLGAGPSEAAFGRASAGAHFAVSTSSDPLVPDAGGVVRTFITLANTGDQALRLTLRPVGVRPLDDGRVQVLDQPDPTWGAASRLPGQVALPPQSYRRVPLTVTVPAGLLPDLYLLGYLAEAVPDRATTDAVVVRNQISALVTVELPGARARRLQIDAGRGGFLRLGREFTGTFRVRNTGVAAALFRDQVRVDSAIGASNLGVVQPHTRKQLLLAGTSRAVTYHWRISSWWQIIRPTVEVAYNNDGAAPLTVVKVGRPVLLLPVGTIFVVAGLLALLAGLVVYRIRKRRPKASTRPRRAAPGRHMSRGRRGQPVETPSPGHA